MKRVVEFTGKKVQDAVNEGLKQLGITLDDADIEILSNGGLFKKAKVAIHYDDGLKEGEAPKNVPVQQSAPAAPEKSEKKETAPRTERKAPKEKKTEVPEGEPHWGSAPVKREPTTMSDFGKNGNKSEEKETQPTEEKAPKPNEQRRAEEKKAHKERKPRESAEPTPEQIAFAKEFMGELLSLMKIEGQADIAVDDGLRINVETEDARVIGHRGEVLDAMQQIISSLINTSHGNFVHVTVDGLGYRDRRKDSLENLARRMADKAVRTHRKVTLDAMNSADRRVIHAALGEREDVFTRSEGHEPARRVVIIPKRK